MNVVELGYVQWNSDVFLVTALDVVLQVQMRSIDDIDKNWPELEVSFRLRQLLWNLRESFGSIRNYNFRNVYVRYRYVYLQIWEGATKSEWKQQWKCGYFVSKNRIMWKCVISWNQSINLPFRVFLDATAKSVLYRFIDDLMLEMGPHSRGVKSHTLIAISPYRPNGTDWIDGEKM